MLGASTRRQLAEEFNIVRSLQEEIEDDSAKAALLQPLKDGAEHMLKDQDNWIGHDGRADQTGR